MLLSVTLRREERVEMNRAYKKLGINVLLFAISSFGTKIIGFLLVPLYTSYLTTTEYGTADMLYTILNILIPVFSLDIADAVIRYVLDKKYKAQSVLLVAMKTIFLGSLVLCLLLLIIRSFMGSKVPDLYYGFLFLNFVLTSLYNTFVNYLKGKERIYVLVVAGLISALLNAGCNILFLTRFGMGVNGYLFANVISVAAPLLYLLGCARHYGYLNLNRTKINKGLAKEMRLYSTPLILNGLAWWINNSLDRVFVTVICGISANGLLAVAYKIPSIISMLQTIFNQAWSLSAIKEFDSEDRDIFIGNVYSYYGCAMTLGSSVILFCNVFLANLLYANDFFTAWQYTGMLVLANLFSGMSVCISGVFNAVKDTKTLAFTTVMGGIVNAILNASMIPWLGIQGAVIATMISNLIVWIWRMYKVRTYIKLNIHLKRDVISYGIVIIQSVIGISKSHFYIIQVLIFICLIILYWYELMRIYRFIVNRVRKRVK